MPFDHSYFKSFGGPSISVDMASFPETEEEVVQKEERRGEPPTPSSREIASENPRRERGAEMPAILVAPDSAPWFRGGAETFSVQPYTDSEDLPAPAPELKIYEESSQRKSPEKKEWEENHDLLLDLEGNPVSGLPPLGLPSELAQPVNIASWPRDLLHLYEKGENSFSELAAMIQRDIARGMKILGFGSMGHSAGTTTLVLGLAREMLMRHYSLLVLDADFGHPSISEKLGISVNRGWEEFLPKREGEPPCGLLRVSLVPEESPRGLFAKKREKKRSQKDAVRLEEFRGDTEGADCGEFYLLPLQRQNVAAAAAVSCQHLWLARFLELAEFFDLVLIDHGVLTTQNDSRKIEELLRFGGDGWYLVDDVRQHRLEAALGMIEQTTQCDFPCLGRIENFI